MANAPKRKFIKPAMTDVGRGPEVSRVPMFANRKKELPAEGAEVSFDGPEGSYWTRRINEGSVAIAEREAPKKKGGDQQ